MSNLCQNTLDGAVLCLTLWEPVDCSPPGSCLMYSSGKNTGAGCHALLQEIFPTQGYNPGLPHCRWILYQLIYQGSPDWMVIKGNLNFLKYVLYQTAKKI